MGFGSRSNPTAQHHAAAPARVRDAAGKVLEIGDEVLVVLSKSLMRVAEIKPLLAPGSPPNAMLVTLVTRMAIAVPRDTGVEDLYVVRHQAEIGDNAIPPAEPPAEEPAQ